MGNVILNRETLLLLRGLRMEPIKHPQTARLRSLKMYREDLDKSLSCFKGSALA